MSRSSSNCGAPSRGRRTSRPVRSGLTAVFLFRIGFVIFGVIGISGMTHADIILDGSFATPALPNNSYEYAATGSPWTFTTSSGIINNSTRWESGGVPAVNPAVNGPQVGFIESSGSPNVSGSIQQSITLPTTGEYQLSYYLAGRLGPSGEGGQVPFSIFLGGTEIGSDESSTGMAFQYRSFDFAAAAGTYELLFQGYEPNPDTNIFHDNTAFFDQISIAAIPEPSSMILVGFVLGGIGLGTRIFRRRWPAGTAGLTISE
jgi:hypothetical protein